MLGDGSYLMMNSEIATSVMLGLKLVIVVLDNTGFGCINRLQMATGGANFNNLFRRHAARGAAADRLRRPCGEPRRNIEEGRLDRRAGSRPRRGEGQHPHHRTRHRHRLRSSPPRPAATGGRGGAGGERPPRASTPPARPMKGAQGAADRQLMHCERESSPEGGSTNAGAQGRERARTASTEWETDSPRRPAAASLDLLEEGSDNERSTTLRPGALGGHPP